MTEKRGRSLTFPRWGPGGWLVVAACLYSCWLLELVPTDQSKEDGYVSVPHADAQAYRWGVRVADVLAAGCLVLAVRRLRGRLVVAGLLLFAAATLADTILSLDCAPSVDALCRHREQTGTVSLPHKLHQITSVLTFGGA